MGKKLTHQEELERRWVPAILDSIDRTTPGGIQGVYDSRPPSMLGAVLVLVLVVGFIFMVGFSVGTQFADTTQPKVHPLP